MYECDTSAPDPAVNRPIPPLPPVPYSLDDWKGELFWKAMDRIDHSYLRLILRHRKLEDIQLIFSELKDQICPLMFNRFGASVILDLTADAHLLMLVCLNSNGHKAVLVLLACLRTPKQKSDVIYALQPLVAQLVNHQFGSGIIGVILRIFHKTAKETQPILDAIADIFFEMATNLHGSLLLRELLDSKIFLLKSRPSILPKLIADVHKLSHHPYGCVVLEGVIRIGMQDVQRDIVAQLRGGFALMSMHKDARIVVLALIMESKEELAPQIYNEMASSPYFSTVLQDPFGKRVVERAWTCTKKTSHEILPFPDLHEENVWPKKKKSRIHV
ncbi:putative pumilio homolog 7, chloroplastic isoform X2 [Primulina huaijiensis]|uniref:putative pumilio homolog 7, chloroplastic isoform X2 n=1 Tax=Primulina huaijiensis TaxID=1492673 RepID=UPI003CC782D2